MGAPLIELMTFGVMPPGSVGVAPSEPARLLASLGVLRTLSATLRRAGDRFGDHPDLEAPP